MKRADCRKAVTLVELLVVLTIFGLLLALLLPAIFASREASRSTQCKSHLRQLGLAMLMHDTAQGHFPSGGWGYAWIGVPGRGSNRRQPGGWVYSLLPYVDQAALHNLGRGLSGSERRAASARRLETPVATFTCPSRRAPNVWPTVDTRPHLRNPRETDTVLNVARGDYAVNGGDRYANVIPGPLDLSEGDDPNYPWPDTRKNNGICFVRSELRTVQIVDGLSNTYMIGEKYLSPDAYATGTDVGDNESMYSGFCADVARFGMVRPIHDRRGHTSPLAFGSAHPQGCNFVFCDGTVKTVAYTIDGEVHRSLCNRQDRASVRTN